MRRIGRVGLACIALAIPALTDPASGQHRPEGAIDWSPDGSWYPNVRTHPELRMPTQAEANNGYALYLARGGQPLAQGKTGDRPLDRLQLFACRPGYFDRQRGETWPIWGWVTCHVFLSAAGELRPVARAPLNWRWTGRSFELEGTPAAIATVVRPTERRALKP
jgi:hypothetical protein